MKLFQRGYTFIELLVVMVVIGVIGMTAFFGIGSSNNTQAVNNSQLEFITNVRSLMTGMENGADGSMSKYLVFDTTNRSYSIYDYRNGSWQVLQTVSLPKTVNIILPYPSSLALCFHNPNLTTFSDGSVTSPGPNTCPPCTEGEFFACGYSSYMPGTYILHGANGPASVSITFRSASNSTVYKTIVMDGNGMEITRVTPL